MKGIVFLGDSLAELRRFPEGARKEAGVQLHKVQLGFEPSDWKPMPSIGPRVREIRIFEDNGAFRVIYVGEIEGNVAVLHAFRKKSQKTPDRHVALARSRLKQLSGDHHGTS
jgi:phage-related protein